MMPRRHLVVMVKAPLAGRVKTRLAADIGAVCATAFYRHAVAAVLARVSSPGLWNTVLAVSPDTAVNCAAWPGKLARRPQGRGDLGQRMQRTMDRLPPGPVMIIGSDVPGITAAHILRAFSMLGDYDAVFGPAPDGGYWMVGLKRIPRIPRPFAGVRWSSAHALSDTMDNLNGLRIAFADSLADVDGAADLAAAGHAYGRRVRPGA